MHLSFLSTPEGKKSPSSFIRYIDISLGKLRGVNIRNIVMFKYAMYDTNTYCRIVLYLTPSFAQ